jgi:hypothetical protein
MSMRFIIEKVYGKLDLCKLTIKPVSLVLGDLLLVSDRLLQSFEKARGPPGWGKLQIYSELENHCTFEYYIFTAV